MKYFILLATSLILLGLSACGDESCDDTGTPPVEDTAGQVGDAMSEVSLDALAPDDSSDVSSEAMDDDVVPEGDVQEEPADAASDEDAQEEAADAATAEDSAPSTD
jgi:hypothetical protein